MIRLFRTGACTTARLHGYTVKPPTPGVFRFQSTGNPEELVSLSIDGPKAAITLNNAKRGNALDVGLQKLLIEHLENASSRKDVRAIVLTGLGKYFCTGMNLGNEGESLSGNNKEQYERNTRILKTITASPKPVISVINGPCYGGGNGLAMACDFKIASHSGVTFTLSEVKIGVVPAIISKYLVREWGPGKAREAMLTGRPLTAFELIPTGGIHHVAENQAGALKYADRLVERLVSSAPNAMANCKKLVNAVATEPETVQDELIEGVFTEMMQPSPEASYGIQMFREKKTPDWGTIV